MAGKKEQVGGGDFIGFGRWGGEMAKRGGRKTEREGIFGGLL